MKRSIFFSITFIFLIAFIGISASFYLFLKYEKSSFLYSIEKRFDFISQTLFWKLQNTQNPNILIEELKSIDFEPITYPKEILNILKKSKKLKKRTTPFGEIWLLRYKKNYYIFIQSFGNFLLLKDISQNSMKNFIFYFILATILSLLLFVYIAILIKLKPLKTIQKELKKFSKGDLDLDLNVKGSSEITEVANTLNNAIESIKNIMNSRKLLLRNIMHELKTPITKGRITAEMIDDEKQKQRLIKIFERLNSLINELAAIEAMDSGIKPELKEIKANEIIEEAINLGMFDKKALYLDFKAHPTIKADYKLFSIAIKNLIENGLKYSLDKNVKVIVYNDKIEIINRSTPLKKEFSYYLEPFTKEKQKSGFGLGLYLVNNILKLHNFRLAYTHKEKSNIFTIFLS